MYSIFHQKELYSTKFRYGMTRMSLYEWHLKNELSDWSKQNSAVFDTKQTNSSGFDTKRNF